MTEPQLVTLTAALRALDPSPEIICREVAEGDWRVFVNTGTVAYEADAVESLATQHGVNARTNRAEFY